MGIRITSWNVNGIRNPFGYQPWREDRTFAAMFDILEADIVVMQETKIQRKDLSDDMVLIPGWDVYFSLPKHKKGYSGVAIYTRNSICSPVRAEEGITGVLCPPNSTTPFCDLPPDQQIGGYPMPGQLSGVVDAATLDSEGRCVILEFPAFVLIGTYSPANRDESRDDFRLGYLEALDARIRNLVALGKRVILTGDLNVICSGLDTANIVERLRKDAMTMQDFFSTPSRRLFNQLVFEGTVHGVRDEGREEPVLWDLGRFFHPTRQGMFTCWDTKKNARPGNFGSRIDYVLCSDTMKHWFEDANIQEGLMGSDHCPVFAVLADIVESDGRKVHLRDIMNPPGVFQDGKRRREWSTKDLLPMSAKLIPEFDRRRSIKDMFKKSGTTSVNTLPAVSGTLTSTNSKGALFAPALSVDIALTDPPHSASPNLNISPSKSSTPTTKRPQGSGFTSNRPQKKPKTSLSKEPSMAKGQSSLRGFFKPKSSEISSTTSCQPIDVSDGSAQPHPVLKIGLQPQSSPTPAATPNSPEKVFDPIESKESWSKLLGKRVVPKCEHGENCISLVTKKPGINCGRSFYICPRPLGPSGEKERNSQWRCGTFIWSSDWNGSQP
ncbi:Endonuclease/exonuclease/phosphatase [Xylariales sp. PMI_506]|nr:Endonuclease/exonuclease/phosphatase [Xylariales sp. PMI_506]